MLFVKLYPEDESNCAEYVENELKRVEGRGWKSKVKLERKERAALGAVC